MTGATRQNIFRLKRSNVSGKLPTISQLLVGEMAVNTQDGFLYTSIADSGGTETVGIRQIGWDRLSTISGGTVNGSISATTYYGDGSNLTGIPDYYVTGGTYSNGTLTLNRQNGSIVVTGVTNNNGGGGSSGALFYFNLSVPQSPYREISETPTTAIEQTSGVTIGIGVTSTIASFLTPSDVPNRTSIPVGIWSFFLHSYKDNANASFDIFCEVYSRTTGGTETLLFSSDPEPITSNSPNPSMQVSDIFYSGTSLNANDRILVKVRATNTSNQSHVVTFVTEGTSHYSYLKTSFGGGLVDTYTTGFTYSNNVLTIKRNQGQPDLSVLVDAMTGLTVNGNLTVTGNTTANGITTTTISATTYQNLPSQYKSSILTGGTSYTFTDFNTVNTLSINKTVGSSTTVVLNQTPSTNDFYVVKDRKGDSLINPITISGGTYTIDGNSTVLLKVKNNPSLTFLFDGQEYIII